jgi:hypothetical protein
VRFVPFLQRLFPGTTLTCSCLQGASGSLPHSSSAPSLGNLMRSGRAGGGAGEGVVNVKVEVRGLGVEGEKVMGWERARQKRALLQVQRNEVRGIRPCVREVMYNSQCTDSRYMCSPALKFHSLCSKPHSKTSIDLHQCCSQAAHTNIQIL